MLRCAADQDDRRSIAVGVVVDGGAIGRGHGAHGIHLSPLCSDRLKTLKKLSGARHIGWTTKAQLINDPPGARGGPDRLTQCRKAVNDEGSATVIRPAVRTGGFADAAQNALGAG